MPFRPLLYVAFMLLLVSCQSEAEPGMVLVGNADKDNGDPGQLERLFPNGRLNIIPGDHNTTYRKGVFAAATMAFLKGG